MSVTNDIDRVLSLKRIIRTLSAIPGAQLNNQLREDMVLLEELISECGGDTRNDLRVLTKEMYDIGDSNARQSEYFHKHQDEPNVDGPDEDDLEGEVQ